MRQWMCDPVIMCDQHLLGEHVEHHMFVGAINKGTSIKGFLDNNLLEINTLQDRHQYLVEEMNRRGMNHKSPLPPIDITHITTEQCSIFIDRASALENLLSRCSKCKERHDGKGETQHEG